VAPRRDSRALTVSSTDSACDLSATEAPAGTLSFDVTNAGTQVTEFYLLGEDGLRIVAEVENVGPQLTRQLVVNAPAGKYVTACKPGMTGEGIRADFTVTESDEEVVVSANDQELIDQAQSNYAAYVQDQRVRYNWVPIVTGGVTLYLGITAVLLIAIVRKRRAMKRRLREMANEESSAEDEAWDTLLGPRPAPPPPSPPAEAHDEPPAGPSRTLH
jgi:hypothetical protein